MVLPAIVVQKGWKNGKIFLFITLPPHWVLNETPFDKAHEVLGWVLVARHFWNLILQFAQ
jgi:hypothetical protein